MNIEHHHRKKAAAATNTTSTTIDYSRFENIAINDDDNEEDDDRLEVARREAGQQIQAAMAMLPLHLKEAYIEACERAPGLVATESDPLLFLRFEKSYPDAAARRLAGYWRLRKEVFGPDRAFRPMDDLSGHGALLQQEVQLLKCGFVLHLPKDKQGRTVLYSDRSKRNDEAYNLQAVFRVVFLALQTAIHNPVEGFVYLLNMSNPLAVTDKQNVKFFLSLLHDFPIRMHQLHLTSCPPRGINDQALTPIVHAETNVLRASLGCILRTHIASSASECLGQLSAHDLLKECLPVSFGGTWTGCEPWHVGVNRRLPLPLEPDVTCLIRNTLWFYIHSINAGGGGAAAGPSRAVASGAYPAVAGYAAAAAARGDVHSTEDDTMDDDDDYDYKAGSTSKEIDAKKRTRRERHAVNSRQRRAKEKIEHEVMFQEYLRQKEMNDSLQREQERLQRLLCSANQATTTEEKDNKNNNNAAAAAADDDDDNRQNRL